MSLNQVSLDLIVEFEGLRLKAYPDPATNAEPWTIGVGHTSAAGPPKVSPGMTITKDEAYDILRSDLVAVERAVQALVKVPLTANQYGALVSFTFNLGAGNFGKSTLLKKVNAKDWNGAAREFAKWDKAAGKTMAGLTRRRAAEAALFSSRGAVADLGPIIPPPVAPIPRQDTFDGGGNGGIIGQPDVEPIDPKPIPRGVVVSGLAIGAWIAVAVVVMIVIAIFAPLLKG